ncbi:MAG: NifB/NifX family molybdenum-iron cluster-binding protein [Promethearchaeota archaeon]
MTYENGQVAHHFGHTPQFLFVRIENGKEIERKIVDNPGYINHQPGVVPQFIISNGAHWIITGGMGPMAVQMFVQSGVNVVQGITGSVDEVIKKIIDGTLKGGESLCEHARMSPEEHKAYHHDVHG